MNTLHEYDLTAEVYSGAHSRVFRGARKSDGLPVIVKTHANAFPDNAEIDRYVRDFDIGTQLRTSWVIEYYDLIRGTHGSAVVEEDFGAESLAQYIRGNEVGGHEVLSIAIQLASGLDAVHAGGIVHKGITPDNILINPTHAR